MTGIISVGFSPGAFTDDVPSIPTYTELVEREDLTELVDLVEAGIDRYGDVVVVYPDWAAEPTLRRLQTVRAALDTTNVVGHRSGAPPLAGGVLVTLAAGIAPHLASAGLLLAALPVLERQLITVTWLAKVTGLEDPAPSVWQHLVSHWPGSAFVVTSWPEPAILRLGPAGRTVPLPRPRRTIGVAIADSEGDPDWVREDVLPLLGAPRVCEVEPNPHAARWWGSRRVTEVVLHPIDLPDMAERLTADLRRGRCAWCRHDVAALTCPFCGLPSTGPAGLGLRAVESPDTVEAGALIAEQRQHATAASAPDDAASAVARGPSPTSHARASEPTTRQRR